MQTKDFYDNFYMGFQEMKDRLNPTQILINGVIPEEIKDEVIPLERGYELFGGKTYNKEDMIKRDEQKRKAKSRKIFE